LLDAADACIRWSRHVGQVWDVATDTTDLYVGTNGGIVAYPIACVRAGAASAERRGGSTCSIEPAPSTASLRRGSSSKTRDQNGTPGIWDARVSDDRLYVAAEDGLHVCAPGSPRTVEVPSAGEAPIFYLPLALVGGTLLALSIRRRRQQRL